MQDGDETLKGPKQLWLYNPENMSDEQSAQIKLLKGMNLMTSTAWGLRKKFRWLREYTYAGNARNFFSHGYDWAYESELQPIIKVATLLKKRLTTILTSFRHRISN